MSGTGSCTLIAMSSSVLTKNFAHATPDALVGLDLGVTGSRTGMSAPQAKVLLSFLQEGPPTRAHHGDCVGVDAIFHGAVRMVAPQAVIIGHPPTNDMFRAFCPCDFERPPKDYLYRNAEMVAEINHLLAFPNRPNRPGPAGGGTWATIRYARKRKIPITICRVDGTVQKENQ